MIRRLIFFDLLSFAPAFFFVSLGEILAWVGITFVIGIIIVALSFRQLGNMMRSISKNQVSLNLRSFPSFLAPSLAGLLFIIPGLITDLLATVVLLAVILGVIKRMFFNNGDSVSTEEDSDGQRIIVPKYKTIDESRDNNTEKKTDDFNP